MNPPPLQNDRPVQVADQQKSGLKHTKRYLGDDWFIWESSKHTLGPPEIAGVPRGAGLMKTHWFPLRPPIEPGYFWGGG